MSETAAPLVDGEVRPVETVPLNRDIAPYETSYVYAIGRVVPRFPSPGVEKEALQAMGRGDTAGLTDREALHKLLSERRHRYLARNICYVFAIEGMETYILQPRDPADFELLVEAIRPAPRPTDIDVVIGIRGPLAPPEMCNGLVVPVVLFDNLYSFDLDALVGALPRPSDVPADRFTPAAEELLARIMQASDNAGATDEDRALNYLAVRYAQIYGSAAEEFARGAALDQHKHTAVPLEQHKADRGCGVYVHEPHHGRREPLVRAGGCDGAVPVFGEQDCALRGAVGLVPGRPARRGPPRVV